MNREKRLIVNADGFGFGAGANRGIIEAIREGGFISSISVNANFPEMMEITEIVREFPHISIGVHLNAMAGTPCLPAKRVPTLVGEEGHFHESRFPLLLRKGLISMAELEAEFDAQIAALKNLAGNRLTHLDSQENTHLGYLKLFLKLARKWGIQRIRNNASLISLEALNPGRSRILSYVRKPHIWGAHQYRRYQMQKARANGMRMADALITIGYARLGNKTNPDNWKRMLKNLPAGTYEIYCHPAYPDHTLRRWAVYCQDREKELEVLRQKWLRETALAEGVEIISFFEI